MPLSLLSACWGEPAALTATHTAGSSSPGSAASTTVSSTGSTSTTSGHASNWSTSFSTSAATTTGTTTAQSTAENSGPSSTSFLWDVGSDLDFDDGIPIGCKTKKIDFLFLVAQYRVSNIEPLDAAWPVFIDTITSKFESYDYHIMVIDADSRWGVKRCTDHCPSLTCLKGDPCCIDTHPPGENCCNILDYPCDQVDLVTSCDSTLGSGMVFPASYGASQQYCKIDGGRRYLTNDQSNISETFTCIATVGIGDSNLNRIGDALEAAISPEINAPGGCNEGFLRDDALLVVTIVSTFGDDSLFGTYPNWYWSLRLAKDDNPNAITMFVIGKAESGDLPCDWEDQTCALAQQFTKSIVIDANQKDYTPYFDEITDMVLDVCKPTDARN